MFDAPLPSRARLLGVVYLLYFVTAIVGGILIRGLVVHDNVAATVRNFQAHEASARTSSAMGLVSILLYLVLTALFYELLRPVDRILSLVATLFSITGCGIQAFGDVFFASLQVVATSLSALPPEQVRGLAEASLVMHAQAIRIALVPFGGFDVLLGILIVRSGFLPRIFGWLMVIAGVGWLIYLWPPLGEELSRVIQPIGFLSEAVLMMWLLAKGIDEEQWRVLAHEKPAPSRATVGNFT